jgi:hypothetical protein
MASPSTVVHVGYHKTASSWFQRSYYPHVTSHRTPGRDAVLRALVEPSAFAFDPARARAQLAATGLEPPWIVSHEELSGHPHVGGLMGLVARAVAERVRAALPDARIAIFLRHQVEVIASCYKEYVHTGGTHRPRRYVLPHERQKGSFASPFKAPRFSLDHFDYAGLVGHYDRLFGRERVHVFLYEDFTADPASFLERYAARLGFELDARPLDPTPVNVSYGRHLIPFARWINHFSARNVVDKRTWLDVLPHRARVRLLDRLNRSPLAGAPPDARALLGREVVEAIERRHAEGNRRLVEERGLGLSRYAYPGT